MKKLFATATIVACGLALSAGAVRADDKKDGMQLYRASALHLKVTNDAGEDLGRITDWTVKGDEHKLYYGIVSYGGVAGVGGKLFAVPYKALSLDAPSGNPENKKWKVKATKADLDKDPGFTSAALPQEGNATLFKFEGGKDVKKEETKEGDKEAYKKSVKRLSELEGLRIQNKAGEDLGRFLDFMVNAKDGTLIYGALSFGGVAGVGDKLFAVPCEAISMGQDKADPNKVHFLVEVPKNVLQNSEGYDQKNWPPVGNKDFLKLKSDADKK